MQRKVPCFLGLGTQKGGTTTLHHLLRGHPQVFMPCCKEVHYFDLNFQQPLSWYANHFGAANDSQSCGEITPFYLFHPKVPERIHQQLPMVKMIVLLRDPVERAISQIFHARKRGFETLSPAEAIAAEPQRLASGDPASLQKHSYVSRSRYIEQLDRYEAFFPRDQILVLQSETLFKDQQKIWQQLQQFLELDPMPLSNSMPKANPGDSLEKKKIDPNIRDRLKRMLAHTASEVRERYGFGWDWN